MHVINLEKEILARTRIAVRNMSLKRVEIVEWAFGDICPRKDEVVVSLPEIGCNVCIPKNGDHRER
jgi:hypothetical protein